MMDVLNEKLIQERKQPVAFEHDCREGICGACSMVINGMPHGPQKGTTTCQLHMRQFKDGDTIVVEPWRAAAFPVIKDLVVDRSAFDRIIQSGGYISVNTGQAVDGNSIPIEKDLSGQAFDAATCILLPQGQVEASQRVLSMVSQMDEEGFGMCSNVTACEAECPKQISVDNIARMNREYMSATLGSDKTA